MSLIQHGMMVNASKTELLMCGDRRQLARTDEPPQIEFMGQVLALSRTVKNLGVVMDPELTWEAHINTIINRCFGILIGLMHIRHIIPHSVLPRLVDSLVFSHIRYCAPVFGSANRTAIARLQKVFNFSARVISGRRKFEHISDVLEELAWLPAADFIAHADLSLIHSILTSGKPHLLRSYLSYNHEHVCRDTRQSHLLALSRVRNNHGKRRFTYRAASLYNRTALNNGFAQPPPNLIWQRSSSPGDVSHSNQESLATGSGGDTSRKRSTDAVSSASPSATNRKISGSIEDF